MYAVERSRLALCARALCNPLVMSGSSWFENLDEPVSLGISSPGCNGKRGLIIPNLENLLRIKNAAVLEGSNNFGRACVTDLTMPMDQLDVGLEVAAWVALKLLSPPGCPAPPVCCGGVDPWGESGGVLELPLPGLPPGGPPAPVGLVPGPPPLPQGALPAGLFGPPPPDPLPPLLDPSEGLLLGAWALFLTVPMDMAA